MVKIIISMKNLLTPIIIFLSLSASGQYYYQDILDARNIGDKMKTYAANNVRSVSATGYDPQGAKTTDFGELQDILPEMNLLKVATRNGQSVSRQFFVFDNQGRISALTDSTGTIKSITTYTYNSAGNISLIKTVVQDSLSDFSEIEEHQWFYNTSGKPEKMWRIINGKDSSEYRFTIDENGNVADEQLYRRGVGIDPVYYYYDDEHRLTDIVRYDKKARRLLPDFMFEYDQQNRVIQKITTLSTTTPNYLIWRFIYNEKGLKTKEALFNKQKELTGRIEYTYRFIP